ncbi:MAG: FtsQ-type POTRA domain-containing protein [Bacilli bacterium]|nr:FtsQ-type POTRA domain-containing protein [Bacilli bacterium]
MKETKKIRVKVKKRKLKIKNILILLMLVILICNTIYFVLHIRIKNIYILNNKIVSDKEIINESYLDNYPYYFLTFKSKIKSNLLKNNNYIKDVKVTKKNFKVYLDINEYKMLAIYNNKIILENKNMVDNNYKINNLPIITNDINSVYDDFVYYFTKIDDNILLKISQIEYTPNEVDKSRFLLYMNDGNSVYITLTRIEKLNRYSSIVSQMDGKLGIIYLDSGDYIELKD